MQWNPEQVELLVELWSEGKSARAIAAELGSGFTRNSVIGKAHRLDLQHGEKPQKDAARPRKIPSKVPALVPLSGDVETWMCRWPTDEPGKLGLHVCGKTVQPGRHYCAQHCTEAYLIKSRTVMAA